MKRHFCKLIIAVLTFSFIGVGATAAFADYISRSSFSVSKLSCGSCLQNIEDELKNLPGAMGMTADLRRGNVTVDHKPELSEVKIAAAITGLGYPAECDWTASIEQPKAITFAQSKGYGAGCGSGGCGSSGGSGSQVNAWKKPAANVVTRTTMKVANLSCISCLTNIKAELSTFTGTIGMNSDLSKGIVAIDHESSINGNKIAGIITNLDYPAKVISSVKVPSAKSFAYVKSTGRSANAGRGCGTNSPCNATSASWKELLRRYQAKKTK